MDTTAILIVALVIIIVLSVVIVALAGWSIAVHVRRRPTKAAVNRNSCLNEDLVMTSLEKKVVTAQSNYTPHGAIMVIVIHTHTHTQTNKQTNKQTQKIK